MTTAQRLITIGIVVIITMLLRALPFVIFRGGRTAPRFVTWLGRELPRAVMMMLVVYCLKDVRFDAPSGWLPALIAVAATALLHIWKKQMVLSIFGGTAIYMLLIRLLAAA